MSAPIVKVCSMCAGSSKKTRRLINEGYAVSHGLCAPCAKDMDYVQQNPEEPRITTAVLTLKLVNAIKIRSIHNNSDWSSEVKRLLILGLEAERKSQKDGLL